MSKLEILLVIIRTQREVWIVGRLRAATELNHSVAGPEKVIDILCLERNGGEGVGLFDWI